MTDSNDPRYIDIIITHMLHRIWELQVAQLIMLADNDDDRQYIQDIVDKQQQGDYQTPLEW